MTFIINYYKPLLKSHNNIYNKNIILNTNFNNDDELNTIYNPIIGSSIGIPLNIIQYIFTNIL